MSYKLFLAGLFGFPALLIGRTCSPEAAPLSTPKAANPTLVVQWNNAALEGVRDTKMIGAPMVARALAIVNTCAYDAWAAYDEKAVGARLGSKLRRPAAERTLENKRKAISFSAYRALVDLFPDEKTRVFDLLMVKLGLDPNDASTDATTPSGIGNVACAAALDFRHNDGSNQAGMYMDDTGYTPLNPPSTVPVDPAKVVNVNHCQPLQYRDASGEFITQEFMGAQWYKVVPFALPSGDALRSLLSDPGPPTYGTKDFVQEASDLVTISANLTDEQKMIAEYWSDGPHSEQPPGHWDLFGQFVSARDHHTLDEDVKMFFALSNAVFDAGIVAWDAKRAYDSVRPVASIPYLFNGKKIRAWAGPGIGTRLIDGQNWIPYQPRTFPTPPFPEYISGHSTFSAAGARILKLFTGSDAFGDSVTLPAGSSKIEPGTTPAHDITLKWATFREAANQAGISRRYGGIHFEVSDLAGRTAGRIVADRAWAKAIALWSGANREESDTRSQVAAAPERADEPRGN